MHVSTKTLGVVTIPLDMLIIVFETIIAVGHKFLQLLVNSHNSSSTCHWQRLLSTTVSSIFSSEQSSDSHQYIEMGGSNVATWLNTYELLHT